MRVSTILKKDTFWKSACLISKTRCLLYILILKQKYRKQNKNIKNIFLGNQKRRTHNIF